MLKTTRIGIAQHACSNNQDENIERATAGVLECVQDGANIVCLQELVNTMELTLTQIEVKFGKPQVIQDLTYICLTNYQKLKDLI